MEDLDRIAALEYRIAELERQQSQLLQLAKVSYVYRKASDPNRKTDRDDGSWLGYVDVLVQSDPEPLEVQRRPFLTTRQGEDQTFWLPSENECGMLFSPSGEYGNSLFLPGIAFKGFPADVPAETSPNVQKTLYRDQTTDTYDTQTHQKTLNIPNADGQIEHRVGTRPSIRKQQQRQILDTVGDASLTVEAETIELKLGQATVTIEADKITQKVGTTHIEITATEIKGQIGTTRFKFNTAKADIRVGAAWIVLLPTLANLNGATFTAGATNLLAPGPVTYPIVPAGGF